MFWSFATDLPIIIERLNSIWPALSEKSSNSRPALIPVITRLLSGKGVEWSLVEFSLRKVYCFFPIHKSRLFLDTR